jgi:beta-1,2-mannobiose phosphorylase / 1,2-beta-oligomannan phosphorylase
LKRFEGNPILEAIGKHSWESRLVFNAAAIYADKQVHLIYRAMGNDHISRLGYAVSSDGYYIDERLPYPVFEPSNLMEAEGVEDPRLTLIGDEVYMAYTAFGNYVRQKLFQIGLTSITLKDFLNKEWKWRERIYPFMGIRNKNGVLLPKKIDGEYVLFHRLDPDISIARSKDFDDWCGMKFVMGPRQKSWDSWKVGTTGPPFELNEGWLFIYHGVNFEKRYSLGVALLDRDNPEVVKYRCEDPILTPQEDYERFGDVQNVVYSCGNVLLDGKVLVYYGGADSVLGVATFDLSELLPKK